MTTKRNRIRRRRRQQRSGKLIQPARVLLQQLADAVRVISRAAERWRGVDIRVRESRLQSGRWLSDQCSAPQFLRQPRLDPLMLGSSNASFQIICWRLTGLQARLLSLRYPRGYLLAPMLVGREPEGYRVWQPHQIGLRVDLMNGAIVQVSTETWWEPSPFKGPHQFGIVPAAIETTQLIDRCWGSDFVLSFRRRHWRFGDAAAV